MLKTNVSIKQISKEIKRFLSQFIQVDMLVLYGSYAYGSPKEESDFDIAVISDDFAKMAWLDKINIFSQAALVIDSRVELKGYSKREFLRPPKGSLLEIIRHQGKVLYSS